MENLLIAKITLYESAKKCNWSKRIANTVRIGVVDRFLFITGAIRSQLDFNRLLVFIFALDVGFFILKTKGTKNDLFGAFYYFTNYLNALQVWMYQSVLCCDLMQIDNKTLQKFSFQIDYS